MGVFRYFNDKRNPSPRLGQRRERYLMVHTPTVSRFGVSHGSPDATVANAKTANSRIKIVHGVALRIDPPRGALDGMSGGYPELIDFA